jgi:hypothetical protein
MGAGCYLNRNFEKEGYMQELSLFLYKLLAEANIMVVTTYSCILQHLLDLQILGVANRNYRLEVVG